MKRKTKKRKVAKPAKTVRYYRRFIIDMPCAEPENKCMHLTCDNVKMHMQHFTRPIYADWSVYPSGIVTTGPSRIELSADMVSSTVGCIKPVEVVS